MCKMRFLTTVELDFSGCQNKRQLDFKRQNENDCFYVVNHHQNKRNL